MLIHLQLDPDLVGVPWAFLPDKVKELLLWRVCVNAEQLDSGWRRAHIAAKLVDNEPVTLSYACTLLERERIALR